MTEIQDLILADSAFQECAGINSGGSMPLEINQVPGLLAIAAVEEVIESNFEQRGE